MRASARRLIALLASLTLTWTACDVGDPLAGGSTEPGAHDSHHSEAPTVGATQAPREVSEAAQALEPWIEARIRDWFALYEDASPVSSELAAFLSRSDVQLRLRDEILRGRDGLLARPAEVRSHFRKIEIEIGPIEVVQQDSGSFLAKFHVDRQAWDAEDLLHIAATHHLWQVELDADERPRLVEAEEIIVVPHPSTGTRVLCL